MYSATQRLGSLLSFATSLILLFVALTAISSFYLTKEPVDISLSINSVTLKQIKEGHYKTRTTDILELSTFLDIDFSSLFNWNVKEVFAFLVVEYNSTKTAKSFHNELVLWDRVIVSKNIGQSLSLSNSLRFATLPHKFKISSLTNKYPVVDLNNLFRKANAINEVRLTLKWTTFPWMGMIFHKASGETSIPFSILL